LPDEIRHLTRSDAGSRFVGRRVFFRSLRVGDAFLLQARDKHATDQLTVRETEIARLASIGLSYNEVAKHLAISPATVRNHLSNVYHKLSVRKQAEIVSMLVDIE
jgi:DNA-binding CsgD family transcriptional regulator